MKRLRHAWLLAFPALAFACQLVDPESDLQEDASPGSDASPGLDAAVDANVARDAVADATLETGADAGMDATTAEAAPSSSLCSGVDADICEDFNRDNLDGDPFWSDAALACNPPSGNGNATVRFYGQYLDTRLPNGANYDASCYLQSVTEPAAARWTLDFDLSSAFFNGGARTYLTIARADFNYDSGVDGSIRYQSFLLQVSNDNVAKLVEVEQLWGMAAPEQAPIADTNGVSFLTADAGEQTSSCHIKMLIDLVGPQLSSAISTCMGRPVSTYPDAHDGPLFGNDSGTGPAVIFLGFDDESANIFPASDLLYDNVILRPYTFTGR